MRRAIFRFYAELNDFLPRELRHRCIARSFQEDQTVKHLIESLGVPHGEVDLILAEGEPVGFDYRPADGDRISVYPMFESFDISSVSLVRPEPLRHTRFVADAHLGRLAAYLRLCGFDTLQSAEWTDTELAAISSGQRRILLTRDRGLLLRRAVTHGYSVRATLPRAQLREVLGRFDLAGSLSPFTRCLRCNTPLEPAPKQAVIDRVPPRSRCYEEFRRCGGCGRVYWPGSHYRRMLGLLQEAAGL